ARPGVLLRPPGRPGRSAGVPISGGGASGTSLARGHRLRQPDDRAVLPQPLEGVEHALFLVLDVDGHVGVVEKDPASFALAFPAEPLGPRLAPPGLNLLDD